MKLSGPFALVSGVSVRLARLAGRASAVTVLAAVGACSSSSPARPAIEDAGILDAVAPDSAAPDSAPGPDDAGGAEGAAPCPSPSLKCQDPKNPPSYASAVAPIIQQRCSPCHFPGGIMSNIDLSTYTNVVNAESAMVGQLYSCAMPPVHGDPKYGIAPGTVPGLTTDELNTLVDWLVCGAPDN